MTNETQTDRLAEVLQGWRQREVQMMGAAISRRDWHEMESAYNQLRDKMDSAETRNILRSLAADLANAEAALHKAIAWFDEYADQHERKATETSNVGETLDRLEKAKRNKARADELRAALNPGKESA